MANKTDRKKDIMDTALSYLEHRARSVREMKNHLAEKNYGPEEIAGCVERLAYMNYLDDTAYAEQYVRLSFEKRRGRMRIERELSARGISVNDIEDAYYLIEDTEGYSLDEIEGENARFEAEKIMDGKEVDEKLLGRLGRKLASLGYKNDLIYSIIGEYRNKKGR
jgi:regulatory protein